MNEASYSEQNLNTAIPPKLSNTVTTAQKGSLLAPYLSEERVRERCNAGKRRKKRRRKNNLI
jgi:hypothetical protein